MKPTMFVVVLAGLVAAPAGGEEKYTIKLKKDAVGDIVRTSVELSEKTSSSFAVVGHSQRKESDTHSLSIYTEEILEKKPEERPTKRRRTYEKGEAFKDGKNIIPSFLGKTVLIERYSYKNKSGYIAGIALDFCVDGKAPAGDDAEFLNREFKDELKDLKRPKKEHELEDLLLPKKAVALREDWRPAMAPIVDYFSEDARLKIDPVRSTVAGRLLKTYIKDGKQFGVFEVTLELALTEGAEKGSVPAQFDPASKAMVTWQFDGCIDGSRRTGAVQASTELQIISNVKVPDGTELKFETSMHSKASKISQDLTHK